MFLAKPGFAAPTPLAAQLGDFPSALHQQNVASCDWIACKNILHLCHPASKPLDAGLENPHTCFARLHTRGIQNPHIKLRTLMKPGCFLGWLVVMNVSSEKWNLLLAVKGQTSLEIKYLPGISQAMLLLDDVWPKLTTSTFLRKGGFS